MDSCQGAVQYLSFMEVTMLYFLTSKVRSIRDDLRQYPTMHWSFVVARSMSECFRHNQARHFV